ncbi:twin-arginine translocation signal domain-containing protein [Halorientalis marina]|uniref:twin-arginine translocation signal domain-containing protein n=1 Tax=Halorientalis marina TaxID=2931976 RepID=UPI001FF10805|nr:twin-arginine translocation signal domain-containing protein [Halorientalis marina]
MGKSDRSRRSFLQATAGLATVVAAGSTAGCLDSVPLIGGGGSLSAVPEDTNGVVYADIDAIREDEGVRTVTDAYLSARSESEWYDGPEDYEEALEEFEDESDLDPEGAHEIVAFAEYGGEYSLVDNEYTAVIVDADWDVDDVVDSIEEDNNYEFDEEEHSGQPFYEPDEDYGSYIGVLGDDRMVIGQEDAVEDAIDADQGEDDGIEDELDGAYSNTRSAPVRYASIMPDPGEHDSVPESYGRGEDEVDLGVLEDVTTVAGAVYAEGDTRGVEVTMTAEDTDTAENLTDIVEGAISYAEENTYDETAAALLGDLEVSQNGTDVTVSFERTIDELEDLIDENMGQ